jgi:hypothetical protein
VTEKLHVALSVAPQTMLATFYAKAVDADLENPILGDRFPFGELQFDAFNRLGIKSQWTNTVVRRSGAKLYWGIDGPEDILEVVAGVRLLAWVSGGRGRWVRGGALLLPRHAAGNGGPAGIALHGAVSPLRLLRPHAKHWLPTPTMAPTRGPWPAATVIGPHQLQRPNVRAAKRYCKCHVRIGMLHLDDLEERPGANGDRCTGLEHAAADGRRGDIIQQACRPLRRQARHQQFR